MPPSIEISCLTILIDRQSGRNGLYRRGGAFARIRLDFCVMRVIRERENGGIRDRKIIFMSTTLPLSRSLALLLSRTHHPHTRFTSVRKPTPVGPTAR